MALLHVDAHAHRKTRASRRRRLLALLLMALAAATVLAGLATRRRRHPAVWHEAPERPTSPARPGPLPDVAEPFAAAVRGPGDPVAPPGAERDPREDIEPLRDPESLPDALGDPRTATASEPEADPDPTAALVLPPDPQPRTERVGFGARPVLRLPPQDAPTLDVVAPAAVVSSLDVPQEDEGWGISVLQQCLIAAGILAVGLLVVFLLQLLLH